MRGGGGGATARTGLRVHGKIVRQIDGAANLTARVVQSLNSHARSGREMRSGVAACDYLQSLASPRSIRSIASCSASIDVAYEMRTQPGAPKPAPGTRARCSSRSK